VLAIDQTIEEKAGQKVIVGPKTATLELAPRQAELLAAAGKLGTLSLALRSLADANNNEVLEGGPDDGKNRKGISMVRFGITTNTTPK
jgi:pilus assembly protein CpaB